jgi:hypothetical protein
MHSEHQAAQSAMQEVLDREEFEKLKAAITDIKMKVDAAQVALNEAHKSNAAAVWAHDRFRKQLERQAQARAQGRA